MGKGDRRTRRGKIYAGSFGKSRPKDPSAGKSKPAVKAPGTPKPAVKAPARKKSA